MTDYIQVITTTSSPSEAERIAQALVEARLAACVQVSGPVTSTYRWEGAVQRSQEWLVTAKTRQDLYAAVEQAIRRIHSYQEPEIVAVPMVAGSAGYLAWLNREVTSSSGPTA